MFNNYGGMVVLASSLSILAAHPVASQQIEVPALTCPGDSTGMVEPKGWKVPFWASESEPVISDGFLYIGSADGGVYAFDACTGEVAWRFQTGTPADSAAGWQSIVDATPVISGERLFVGRRRTSDEPSPVPHDSQPNLFALDLRTGSVVWSATVRGGVARTAATDGERVYVVSTLAGVYAFDAIDGTPLWSFASDREVDPMLLRTGGAPFDPLLIRGRVHVRNWPGRFGAGDTDTLYALDAATGEPVWTTALRNIRRGPIAADGLLLVVAGRVEALQALDEGGTLLWTFAPESRDLVGVGVRDGVVFAAVFDSVHAIELQTGDRRWSVRPNRFVMDLEIGDAIVALSMGRLFGLDPATGAKQWSTGDIDGMAVNVSGQTAYVAQQGIQHSAYDMRTGRRRWRTRLEKGPSFVSGAMVRAGSRLFFRTEGVSVGQGGAVPTRGHLYSVEARTGRE